MVLANDRLDFRHNLIFRVLLGLRALHSVETKSRQLVARKFLDSGEPDVFALSPVKA